jgi:hypothetical protein
MDSASLLLGGGITLAGAVFVQSVVVPWTQWRMWRASYWEAEARELVKLLQGELREALSDYRSCALTTNTRRSLLNYEDVDKARVEDMIREDAEAERARYGTVRQHSDRVDFLVDSLQKKHRHAPLWARVRFAAQNLRVAVQFGISPYTLEREALDMGQWDKRWNMVNQSRKALLDLTQPLATELRPPPRAVLSRARDWPKRKLAGRRRAKDELIPGAP